MRIRPRAARHAGAFALLALLAGGWARCGDPLAATAPLASGEWKLSWADEFDGPAGSLPDASRWGFDVGGGGWGNNQLEYDTDRPENAALDGAGNLAITARAESYGGRAYTSARLVTRGLFAQAQGRFEARIHLPVGRGIWPAFWLLGSDFGAAGWPACGEIDVMEYLGHDPRAVLATVHGPGYSGGGGLGDRFVLPEGPGFDAGFHVFAVDWDPREIAFSVDGERYHAVTPASLPPGASWVFDHPFFVILNVAVGGYLPGAPDATTVFPQTMRVDYVRVYGRGP
jgi:beta-glucanase (GH16 family)